MMDELMESSAMKMDQRLKYEILFPFRPLSQSDVEKYVSSYLSKHHVKEVDEIVKKLSAFPLCHGRPRFVAYILDRYLANRKIEVVICNFVEELCNIQSQLFPLRFLKRDVENNKLSFKNRIIDGESLGHQICQGMLNFIIDGEFTIQVENTEGATAIQYGLGFAVSWGNCITQVKVQEMAILECLRPFVPFGDLVKKLATQTMFCTNSQTAGYMIEYFVAFALVANYAGDEATSRIQVTKRQPNTYLSNNSTDDHEVFFPDHMCGPDIMYKCSTTKTLYIVQVKFYKKFTKQEKMNAISTTDPDLFYCNRNSPEKPAVIDGYEEKKNSY
jgi:hypothetical protein